MKRYIIIIFLFFSLLKIFAQERQSITLNIKQAETLFLENNLELLATKFNVDIADAAILQAKLWDNPSLSIGDVNLWSTSLQREGEDQVIPPLFGSFGKNTEFSVELSQLIQTANKRGKLIRREKISKDMASQEFEETLRGLKAELRKNMQDILYSQSYVTVLSNQQKYINQLVESFRKQVQSGNVAKSELLRLQSSLLELENEINEVHTTLNEQEKTLKILLNLDTFIKVEIVDNQISSRDPETIVLLTLFDIADEARPDLKLQKLQTSFHQKSLDYERSLRVPDISLSANYDRHGGVWENFVGFGVSIDLPFFNRNQGNIKAAKATLAQNELLVRQQQNLVRQEITNSYNNYIYAYRFYEKIKENSLLSELDSMLDVYMKNLLNKNISMLEYIDFMDTYRANKGTILNARKQLNMQFEELQYTVGTDIK